MGETEREPGRDLGEEEEGVLAVDGGTSVEEEEAVGVVVEEEEGIDEEDVPAAEPGERAESLYSSP